jgi:sulfite reductase (NADPH) flavoprotein alpha-component
MNNSENTKKTLPGHYSKTHPCCVQLQEKRLLTHPQSTKKTYHVSLDIRNADLQFEPGDSIGILPQNDPLLIQKFFSLLSSTPQELVIDPRSQEECSCRHYLLHKVNLSRINSSLLRYLLQENANPVQKDRLAHLVDPLNKEELAIFLEGKDLLDILALFQKHPSPLQELAPYFTPLLPRFYSISSSLKAYPGEVHLLVSLLSYPHGEEIRYGVASHFLCHLAQEKETPIPIYVQPAAHFKLPEDLSSDLIMIGPGTGVAPYRAFLQERLHQKASGNHWLFFGERSSQYDFLYKDYWMELTQQGKLKLDLAFSRDQKEKVYVHHKLLENAATVWQWISNGAYFYVCGDASRMAKDVDATILHIVQEQGKFTEEKARAYIKNLRHNRKYMTDVY